MAELNSVFRAIKTVKDCIDEDDYESLLDAWRFLRDAPALEIAQLLRNVSTYIGLTHALRGKYEKAEQEMLDLMREFEAQQDKPMRKKLLDEHWNPEKGGYDLRVTENMVEREIHNLPDYKKKARALSKIRYALELCKAVTKAVDSLQYTATELSRLERKDREVYA